MTDGTDDATPDSPLGELTRRAALGAGTAAVLSGLAGCSALDRLFEGPDESPPADGESDETTRDDDGDGHEPLWEAERELRREAWEGTRPSFVPAYEYEPIDIAAADQASGGIDGIVAAPAESTTGDRIVIGCRPDRTERLADLSALLWTDGTRIDSHETTVDGRSVRFDLFADETTAVGLGTIESADSGELLVARADDLTGVERLIETFSDSDVYDRS